jgi:hypothetical protein
MSAETYRGEENGSVAARREPAPRPAPPLCGRFGTKADLAERETNVRLLPKSDIAERSEDVRFVPKADSCSAANQHLLDHLVGAGQERCRHV